MTAQQFNRMMTFARRDAALSAYETALRWLHTYPAHELDRRLTEKILEKRNAGGGVGNNSAHVRTGENSAHVRTGERSNT
jgi:hypothetical protein